MKRIIIALISACIAQAAMARDSTEAQKVAGWLRDAPAADADHSWFNVLGGLSTAHIGPSLDYIRSNGPEAFYTNAAQLAQAKGALQTRTTSYLPLLAQGGIHWYRDVQNMPWGMIETRSGTFRFDLLDALVTDAQTAGGRYVGTVMPYAGWELTSAGYAATTDAECLRLFTEDFYYLAFDRRMDRYKDEAAYLRFLAALVERYDGDGVDDMPGLTTPVRYWQIHNEPEGEHCGLFRNNVAAFTRLMKVSADLIHASCASCKVLNGGIAYPLFLLALPNPPSGGATFWSDFVAAGGATSVDVIAVHYNNGKDANHGRIDDFESLLSHARQLLGTSKAIWVTEFGVVIGNHGNFTGMTEPEAASWFIRFYTAGLAGGVEKFFSDAPSFAETDGTVTLPFYVNKLLYAKLGGFTSATRVAAGQYKFRVGSRDVYVLWSGVPADVKGSVVAADMYGDERTLDASALTPSEASPLIVTTSGSRRRAVQPR